MRKLQLATVGWSRWGYPIVALQPQEAVVAFDADQHKLDDHGFIIDKTTGHRIGLESVPVAAVKDMEFPKWVTPHDSHVMRTNAHGAEHISTPLFADFSIDRVTKAITVLVKDAEEEAKALAPLVIAKPSSAE